jgi:hypothetical protein
VYMVNLSNLLGAFSKLRKATTSFVISVRLSDRLHGTTLLLLDVFFRKTVEKFHVSLKSENNNGYFT